jgi:hypothetical protein
VLVGDVLFGGQWRRLRFRPAGSSCNRLCSRLLVLSKARFVGGVECAFIIRLWFPMHHMPLLYLCLLIIVDLGKSALFRICLA